MGMHMVWSLKEVDWARAHTVTVSENTTVAAVEFAINFEFSDDTPASSSSALSL